MSEVNTSSIPTLSPVAGGIPHARNAALLSVVAAGLGQIYNRQFGKGLLLLALYAIGLYFAVTRLGHAIWGLITLGEQKQQLKLVGKVYQPVAGDHSIFLMVQGLIVLFVAMLLILLYAAAIRDAYRIGKLREQGIQPKPFVDTIRFINDKWFPYMIVSPPLLFVLFFTVLPIVFSILIAFTDYSSPNHLPPANLVNWVGLTNFLNLFQLSAWAKTFYGVFTWTMTWAVLSTVSTFFGGFAIALLVQQKFIRFKSFWRTLYMLPFAIPSFVSLLIMRNFFNTQFGPINQYLRWFGIEGPEWLADPFWAKVTVLIVNFWLGFPISMLLIMGILTTIPREQYEAAEVDGASPIQRFRMITFPGVMYSLAPILIGTFAGNVNNFGVIFLLTGGNPTNSEYQFAGETDLLITWLYKLSITNGKYNFASVISIMIFVIIAGLSIWNFRRTKAFKEEETYR
ncbi:carbohydrate ABC transporter permease [Paenibacillus xanthanilyticus]|uniref:Maltose/maltodextrin transport system permease protein n=1 Tax=Paenibacillus xanthanilyticus TaxID=1783531 RepID=A0ABV8K5Q2_9BACL